MSLRWIPNAISLFRIALVPPVIFFVYIGRYDLALIIFFIAGFSDGLDGFLAKRFNWQSRTGELLDPLADKFLVGGTFIILAWVQLVPVWFTVMVLLRDVIIIGGATIYNFMIRPVHGEPTNISKLNTGLQLLFVVFVLSNAAYSWPDRTALTVVGAAVIVTVVISGLNYVFSWARRARHASKLEH